LVTFATDFRSVGNNLMHPNGRGRSGCGRPNMLTNAMQLVRASLRDRAGVSSIEYGILAVGIIAALTAALSTFSTDLSTAFSNLGALISSAF
jgi:Flp pilus assembly pilin Flp